MSIVVASIGLAIVLLVAYDELPEALAWIGAGLVVGGLLLEVLDSVLGWIARRREAKLEERRRRHRRSCR